MRIVDPVVVAPLRDEWAAIKAEIAKHEDKAAKARDKATKATKAVEAATAAQGQGQGGEGPDDRQSGGDQGHE
jgi:hypothetical protein